MTLFLLALVSFKRNTFWVNVQVPYLSKQFQFLADEAGQAEKQESSPDTETAVDSEGICFAMVRLKVQLISNEMFILFYQQKTPNRLRDRSIQKCRSTQKVSSLNELMSHVSLKFC